MSQINPFKNIEIRRMSKFNPWLKILVIFWGFCILIGCQKSENPKQQRINFNNSASVKDTLASVVIREGNNCLNCKAPSGRLLLLKGNGRH